MARVMQFTTMPNATAPKNAERNAENVAIDYYGDFLSAWISLKKKNAA